jgi:hypothetical protein
MKKTTRSWRKLHKKELHNQYSSLNMVKMIKSGRMKLEGHVARIEEREIYIGFWWKSQKERVH